MLVRIDYTVKGIRVRRVLHLFIEGKLLSEDDNIEGTINAVSNLAKAVPIYEDAVQPLAKQTGKALGTIGEVVNALLMPAQGLVWGADQIKYWMQQSLEKKLAERAPEELVAPDLAIAGPTIESLKYRGHDAEISEMFANLLANDMVKKNKSKVHPTFVETIKELTPLEAKLFASCIDAKIVPVAGFSAQKKDLPGKRQILFPFNQEIISAADIGRRVLINEWQVSIENLERLGLVKLSTTEYYTIRPTADYYEEAEKLLLVLELKKALQEDETLVTDKGALEITQMGINFASVVLRAP